MATNLIGFDELEAKFYRHSVAQRRNEILEAEIEDDLENQDLNLGDGEYESLDSQEAREVVLMEIAEEDSARGVA